MRSKSHAYRCTLLPAMFRAVRRRNYERVHLRQLVARWLYAAFDDERLRGRAFDIIVPVPLHPTRRRERGFNQAGLLAELLSTRISIRCERVLKRIRYTTTQTA